MAAAAVDLALRPRRPDHLFLLDDVAEHGAQALLLGGAATVDDASIDLIEELRRDLPLRPLRTELVAAGLRLIVSVHVEAPVLVQRHAAIHAHIVQLAQHGEQQRRVLDADLQVALQDTESRHQRTEGALDLNAQPALPEVEAVVLDGEPFALERRQNRVAAVGRTGVRVIGADPRVAVVDRMVGVGLCTADDDVLLTTALGRAIRFKADDVRVFKGRDSTGVRGVRLQDGDEVISMAILGRVDATPEERSAYVKHANAMRKALAGVDGEGDAAPVEADDEAAGDAVLSVERIAELGAAEQFILTVTETGFGKRSSAYEYRRTGRGGQGLTAHGLGGRAGTRLAAAFPVEESDDLLLVTSGGQMIRTRIDQVRIVGRSSQGVTIFRTGKDEKVVSVERLPESGGADDVDVAGEEGGEA